MKCQACQVHKISFRFSNYGVNKECMGSKREVGVMLRNEWEKGHGGGEWVFCEGEE